MTALINVGGTLPRPLWALTRFLLEVGRPVPEIEAQRFLSPPSLFGDTRSDTELTFSRTVKIARELGMLEEVGDKLSLTSQLRNLEVDDVEGFYDLLRHAVLHRVAPDVLGSDPSNTEGKDLLRALTFFMTLDHDRKVDVNTFSQAQTGVLSEDLRNPFQNKERWAFFPAWAEALGFAESPLIGDMQARALVPDCRKAVRRTIQQLWPHRVEVHPRDFIDELLRALPVLPGGDYSRSLGFELPATTVSQTLSSALLAAHDDGVIVLSFQSDAADPVALWDPGEGRGVRLVSRVVVEEAA